MRSSDVCVVLCCEGLRTGWRMTTDGAAAAICATCIPFEGQWQRQTKVMPCWTAEGLSLTNIKICKVLAYYSSCYYDWLQSIFVHTAKLILLLLLNLLPILTPSRSSILLQLRRILMGYFFQQFPRHTYMWKWRYESPFQQPIPYLPLQQVKRGIKSKRQRPNFYLTPTFKPISPQQLKRGIRSEHQPPETPANSHPDLKQTCIDFAGKTPENNRGINQVASTPSFKSMLSLQLKGRRRKQTSTTKQTASPTQLSNPCWVCNQKPGWEDVNKSNPASNPYRVRR